MSTVTQIFVNNGTALPAQGTTVASVSSGTLAVFGSKTNSQTQVAAAPTITTEPKLALYLGMANGSVKRSNPIAGANLTGYTGKRYEADKREVWAIGYDRKAATGTLEVANDTDYTFVLAFKFDKQLYSERPSDIRFHFTSSGAATKQEIAIQIAAQINNHPGVSNDVEAIVVGNGTGAPSVTFNGVSYTIFGGTAATEYGVEITGKDIDQFQETTFIPRRPYFSAFVERATGFGTTTTVSQIQAMDFGSGNYDQVYNMENFDYGFEGVVNRRQWPIPALELKASSTYVDSAAITPTVTSTAGEDTATFSATVAAILSAGDRVLFGTTAYEIKYFISTTVAVLTTVAAAHTNATVKKRFKYSIITLDFKDVNSSSIGVQTSSVKSVRIAVPAIDDAAVYNSVSAIGTSLKTLFDAWAATVPGAFGPITI